MFLAVAHILIDQLIIKSY